tara:strand:+ start:5526 stop:6794 length:1269 start_codon:yes stop_codon:yes gene_type:complete
MELDINHTLKQAITAHKEGKFEKAEQFYYKLLKVEPKNIDANHNLGVLKVSMNRSAEAIPLFKTAIEVNPNIEQFWISYAHALINEKRFEESETSYREIIKFTPNNNLHHYNLGKVLKILGKLEEAVVSYKKAIELKPDFVEAYNNLGSLLQKLKRFDEAEKIFKKTIELKSDYAAVHNNMGNLQQDLAKLEEAEVSYKKAIELKPGFVDANNNLVILLKLKKLLSKIEDASKIKEGDVTINLNSDTRLDLYPFIAKRNVETDLFTNLYKISSNYTPKTNDARYGNGRFSNFQFLENNYSIIKILTKDLTEIMEDAVKSKIYIIDSFFNIYKAGCGTTPHTHISNFDQTKNLVNQKFSLTYYIDTGDQKCSEPGILKLYNPDKEILPTKGQIVIIPANQMHSAVYNGKTDRVMIGVNFYSLH